MDRSGPPPAPSVTPKLWRLLGPAFVAAVAYVDPGNVAANLSAGSRFGYLLVWVVVLANLMAAIVQYLSAKLGLVTGQSLPFIVGQRLRKPSRLAYWAQAELVAAATDVAEIVGGALALSLLFHLPLVWGGLITGLISLALLGIQHRHGARRFEIVITALLAIMVAGFCAGLLVNPPELASIFSGLVPRFAGAESVVIATSMLGATVMPHAIYAHSALVRDRFHQPHDPQGGAAPPDPARLLKATRWDVSIALIIAGSVNLAMVLLAASTLSGRDGTQTIEGSYQLIAATLGAGIATAFAVGLLASGLASTSVGAYAGADIMAGLIRRQIPLVLRRIITMLPAIVLLAAGISPTWLLVMSQVVLSFGIPAALIPLVVLTSDPQIMGAARITAPLRIAAWVATSVVVALNIWLLVSLAGA